MKENMSMQYIEHFAWEHNHSTAALQTLNFKDINKSTAAQVKSHLEKVTKQCFKNWQKKIVTRAFNNIPSQFWHFKVLYQNETRITFHNNEEGTKGDYFCTARVSFKGCKSLTQGKSSCIIPEKVIIGKREQRLQRLQRLHKDTNLQREGERESPRKPYW